MKLDRNLTIITAHLPIEIIIIIQEYINLKKQLYQTKQQNLQYIFRTPSQLQPTQKRKILRSYITHLKIKINHSMIPITNPTILNFQSLFQFDASLVFWQIYFFD